MTSNEKQIDVLIRQYAKAAPRANAGEHLDADELSAFGDGALPPATRARYVSHLADCDDCRKQASALAISSGAVARAEQRQSEITEGRTFWQLVAGLFALPVLRYGAMAAVLLIIAAVAFVALRRPRLESSSSLIARNEPVNEPRSAAVEPPKTFQESETHNKQANIEARASTSPPVAGTDQSRTKADGIELRKEAPAVPEAMKEAAASPPPVTFGAAKKAGEGQYAQAAPSYAPPPPGETTLKQQQEAYREQQRAAGISGPRQQQQKNEPTDKLATLDRERDAAKDEKRGDAVTRITDAPASGGANQLPRNRAVNEKAKGPMRNMENNAINRSEDAARAEAPKTMAGTLADNRASTEEAPQTRSAGGKKFRRQGKAWVDQKFKSSMTLKSISRGSDEFNALDSGLRSIAQQLGGEVIIVRKGKAYLIK